MMDFFPDWAVLCTTIALCSFFITVLLQMVAKAFSLQSLSMWVRAEYAQVAVSFLIIFFALVMVTAGYAVTRGITSQLVSASGNIPLKDIILNPDINNPINIGQAYLSKIIKCEGNMYSLIFIYNYPSEFFSKIGLDSLGIEAIGGGYALGGFVSLFHFFCNNLIYLALFNYVQFFVLQFSQYTMVQIFLPIGLILRAFPVTRGAGGLITAFALGFAFVFPICYVLIVAMMPNTGAACSQVSIMSTSMPPDAPCLNNAGAQMKEYYKLKSEKGKLGGITGFFGGTINVFFLQSMFYPLVALIITFTFIRQTGSLMGADLAEIGRGLIKII
ncbi:MAG: hypothetical protein NTX79_05315 [Candidatus Micrarchaeota archaeon]|nr:hypothetical protein [Candidatus Micrarchaeota archaeon]